MLGRGKQVSVEMDAIWAGKYHFPHLHSTYLGFPAESPKTLQKNRFEKDQKNQGPSPWMFMNVPWCCWETGKNKPASQQHWTWQIMHVEFANVCNEPGRYRTWSSPMCAFCVCVSSWLSLDRYWLSLGTHPSISPINPTIFICIFLNCKSPAFSYDCLGLEWYWEY